MARLAITPHPGIVIPAKAGIHPSGSALAARWIPAFAGMTILVMQRRSGGYMAAREA
jgi:hypothetical protein